MESNSTAPKCTSDDFLHRRILLLLQYHHHRHRRCRHHYLFSKRKIYDKNSYKLSLVHVFE